MIQAGLVMSAQPERWPGSRPSNEVKEPLGGLDLSPGQTQAGFILMGSESHRSASTTSLNCAKFL